eukprot:m.18483 g.18483  ORF g.18483 m.18483 type:complete len:123 (-) comp3677_c0_seq1:83-451(-)
MEAAAASDASAAPSGAATATDTTAAIAAGVAGAPRTRSEAAALLFKRTAEAFGRIAELTQIIDDSRTNPNNTKWEPEEIDALLEAIDAFGSSIDDVSRRVKQRMIRQLKRNSQLEINDAAAE